MGTAAQFASVPKNGTAQVSVANAGRDGTGTLATVYTAGANGARVDLLTVQATGTTTAGMVRLFLDIGGLIRLIREIPVAAVVPGAAASAFAVDVQLNLVMQAGAILKASTQNAETINIIPTICGDF